VNPVSRALRVWRVTFVVVLVAYGLLKVACR
jgi:hypothetical protein